MSRNSYQIKGNNITRLLDPIYVLLIHFIGFIYVFERGVLLYPRSSIQKST